MSTTNLGVLSDRHSLSGRLHQSNPLDRVNFSFAATSALNVGVTAPSADVTLRLYKAATPTPIVTAIHPGTPTEQINLRTLGAGNYFIEVSRVGNTHTPYTLKLSNTLFNDVVAAEKDLGILTARSERQITGTLNPSNTADQVRFQLDHPSHVSLILTGLTNDLDLRVYREDGNGLVDVDEMVGVSINTGNQPERLNLALAAGEYIIQIQQLFDVSSVYTLKLAVTDSSPLQPDVSHPDRSLSPSL